MFTGASQFALVGVVGAGGGVWAGALAAALLGSRNALYGLRLASLLDVHGWRRIAAAQFVIDETTAMAIARDDPRLSRFAFMATDTVAVAAAGADGELDAVDGLPPHAATARTAINGINLRITQGDTSSGYSLIGSLS